MASRPEANQSTYSISGIQPFENRCRRIQHKSENNKSTARQSAAWLNTPGIRIEHRAGIF